jgi:hypothetical protein
MMLMIMITNKPKSIKKLTMIYVCFQWIQVLGEAFLDGFYLEVAKRLVENPNVISDRTCVFFTLFFPPYFT